MAYDNWLHYIFEVPGQNGPLRTKKRPFWAQIGYAKSGFFSKTSSSNWLKSHKKYSFGSITMSENDGQDHPLKIFQGAKIEIFGPAHMPIPVTRVSDVLWTCGGWLI